MLAHCCRLVASHQAGISDFLGKARGKRESLLDSGKRRVAVHQNQIEAVLDSPQSFFGTGRLNLLLQDIPDRAYDKWFWLQMARQFDHGHELEPHLPPSKRKGLRDDYLRPETLYYRKQAIAAVVLRLFAHRPALGVEQGRKAGCCLQRRKGNDLDI